MQEVISKLRRAELMEKEKHKEKLKQQEKRNEPVKNTVLNCQFHQELQEGSNQKIQPIKEKKETEC